MPNWRQVYNGLQLFEDASDVGGEHTTEMEVLERMAWGHPFLAYFITGWDPGGATVFHEKAVELLITGIPRINVKHTYLEVAVKIIGETPPGVRRGAYKLHLDNGKECYDLPPEMFEEGGPENEAVA